MGIEPAVRPGQRTGVTRAATVILALTLLAWALRVFRLDFVSLRGDEAFTVIFVQRTWEGLWKGIRLVEPNPPLFYLLLRAWVAVAGASEFATRFFSVAFGVLCVPLAYRLGRQVLAGARRGGIPGISGAAAAVMAAALMAINPYQVWHSQDVRNYTLWPALSLISLILFWRWWTTERRASGRTVAALALYGVATTASLYTHYYDTFVLVAENLFVVLTLWRAWRSLARWFAAQAVLALVYLPWVLFFTNRVTTYGEASAMQSVSLVDQFARTLSTLILGNTVPGALAAVAWVPLALAAIGTWVMVARRDATRAAFLGFYIGVPTLALYAISIGRPLFLERYLNVIAPGYYLLFAIGLAAVGACKRLGRLRKPAFAAGVLFFVATAGVALGNYYFDPAYAKAPDWRSLSRFIAARRQEGDMVIQNFNEMAAIYYQNGSLPVMTLPRDFWPNAEDERILRQVMAEHPRIWFIPAPLGMWDSDRMVETYLSRHADREIAAHFGDLRLELYATPRAFEPRMLPIHARVGQVTLAGYRMSGLAQGITTPSGTTRLHVVLYWRTTQPVERDWTVFLHLADANGRVIAQQDRVPAGGLPTRQWATDEWFVDAYDLDWDAEPGVYTLVAGMYDPVSLQRAQAVDANGVRFPEDRVLLTPITVTP